METLIVVVLSSVFITSLIVLYISKKINESKYEIYTAQAKAKAKVIEHEAELLLKDAQMKIKKDSQKEFDSIKKDYDDMFYQLESKERDLNRYLDDELEKIDKTKNDLIEKNSQIENIKKEIKKEYDYISSKKDELLKVLENASGLTKDEAKIILLDDIKDKSRVEIASLFRKEFKLAQKNSEEKINNILANAVTRYAGQFAVERLITNIPINCEEVKGKIIGKEGRNIKSLEIILGVDIIIDATPNNITVSSFNLYRRAVATRTIEELLEDGRVQPAKIEEIYNKVKNEFDDSILKEGEEIVYELGIHDFHPELVKLIGKLRYRASYGQNALAHTLEVANLAGLIASQMGGDTILARRAGLMHDIGKSLTYENAGSHVDLGVEVCKKYDENPTCINAIYAHHGHEEPINIESAAVCAADALSAARPGARREVLESFLKRVEEVEKISNSKFGVINSFAINAGREVRVIVKASLVNDDESILMANEIAKDIEAKVQYPGEIKVSVIRELRTSSYAR